MFDKFPHVCLFGCEFRSKMKNNYAYLLLLIISLVLVSNVISQAIGFIFPAGGCTKENCLMACCARGYCASYFLKYCTNDVCNCVNDCQPGSGLKEINGYGYVVFS